MDTQLQLQQVESKGALTNIDASFVYRHRFILSLLQKMSFYQRLDLKNELDQYTNKLGFHHYKHDIHIPLIPLILDRSQIVKQLKDLEFILHALGKFENYAFSHSGKGLLKSISSSAPEEWITLMRIAQREPLQSKKMRNKRFDCFIRDGNLIVLELNSICPQGILPFYILEERRQMLYNKLGIEGPIKVDIIKELLNWFLNEHKFRNPSEVVKNIGIIFETKEEPGFQFPIFSRLLKKKALEVYGLNLNVYLGSPQQVSLNNKKNKMYLKGKPIDVIWKNAITSLDYDFSSYGYKKSKSKLDVKDFLTIISNSDRFTVINSERSRFFSFKKIFAYLSNPLLQATIKLSGEEKLAIKKHIPQTFDISNCNRNFLLQYKDQLIVKDALGSYGNGIYFGKNYSSAEWKKLVDTFKKDNNFIVQEYLDYKKNQLPIIDIDKEGRIAIENLVADFNPQHINGAFLGSGWSRFKKYQESSKLAPLNLSSGGGQICVELV